MGRGAMTGFVGQRDLFGVTMMGGAKMHARRGGGGVEGGMG